MDIYVITYRDNGGVKLVDTANREDTAIYITREKSYHYWTLSNNINKYLLEMDRLKLAKYTLVGDTFVEDKEYTLKTGETDK